MNHRKVAFIVVAPLLISACAFDVVTVERVPTKMSPTTEAVESYQLRSETTVDLGTNYSRTLKAGTRWNPVGSVPQGRVFATEDQVLTVEGSNIYEAYLVLRDAQLVGFYLPANEAFSPLTPPVELNLIAIK